jgi:hypothetical protein
MSMGFAIKVHRVGTLGKFFWMMPLVARMQKCSMTHIGGTVRQVVDHFGESVGFVEVLVACESGLLAGIE